MIVGRIWVRGVRFATFATLVAGCSSSSGDGLASPASGGAGAGGASSGGTASSGGGSAGGAATGGTSGGSQLPTVGACTVFTADDAWNRDVSADPVDATWTTVLFANATLKVLHPDFGSGFGIPFNVVPQSEPLLPISFDYSAESDPGPYPFPGDTAKIEGGTPTSCSGDCHVIALQQGMCLLYEGYGCLYSATSVSWHCGSGAKFDLTKNSYGQRPAGWTSADAAGLAILPGLAKYSEVAAGAVNHAIRFTMHCTQDGYVAPASHQAVPNACPAISQAQLEADYPPMGLRVRLKSTFDVSTLTPQARIVATAMQKYGMILADNGSDYYFQGDDDPSWDDADLGALKAISGDQLEVLVPGPIAR